ncbi:DNA replication and repair protein RecF [Candidatus Curtissbacteria bacterium]|nr:DNA replication and repair protein RecF [Candidatus Curtissbacteria bacterium]
MNIASIQLTNFRNFTSRKVIFDPKLTVIVGPNGSGKSNILEAVGLLAAVRIHKVDTDLDFVRFGQADSKIEGRVKSLEDSKMLTINLQVDPNAVILGSEATPESRKVDSGQALRLRSGPKGREFIESARMTRGLVRKTYFIDSIKKRLVDFTEHFAVVCFEPSDLELVWGSPSERRHHLDTLLASVDRDYWRAITSYNKIVVRRNKILQRILDGQILPSGRQAKKSELDFWDERLLEHGKFLSKARAEFFEFVNLPAGRQVLSMDFTWQLKQSLLTPEKLLMNRDRDIAAGVTLSGPHRDDFMFLFRGKNLEFFGSRGEARMAVLALKLAELEYFNSKRGARPVLALDDIFSELDWKHREAVLGVIEKQQTIITAAESESLPKDLYKKAKVVELR